MMFDLFSGWSRVVASNYSLVQTGMTVLETCGAANAVIAARTDMMSSAMLSPLSVNHAELGRMVPEKVDAFSRAGVVAVDAWWTAHSAWMEQMQAVGVMASRGRPPTVAELAELARRTARFGIEALEANAKLGSDSLAPVHRRTLSNARRLKRKKRHLS